MDTIEKFAGYGLRNWRGYALGTMFVALATWLKFLALPDIIPADVPITYIAAIVPAAVFFGLGPSLWVCVLSVLAYDYFFVLPVHTLLGLGHVRIAPIILVFFLVGTVLSYLASSLRARTEQAVEEASARRRSEAELAKANLQLRGYGRRSIQLQEEEKRRLAQDLHDDIAQSLAFLAFQVSSLLQAGQRLPQDVVAKLEQLKKETGRTIQDVRRFSYELRPGTLDTFGLKAALETLVEETRKLDKVEINFEFLGEDRRLLAEMEVALFRIAQEALSNVRKHAQAKKASIKLEFVDSRVNLTISDDGKGFDLEQENKAASQGASMGLLGMKERAELLGARTTIESETGKGTRITVQADAPHE